MTAGARLLRWEPERLSLLDETRTMGVDETMSVQLSGTLGLRRLSRELAQGTVINGRYRMVEVLGEGGMGVVYKVEDLLRENRLVALKTLSDGLLKPERVSLLKAEFKTMAQLSHPNIVEVYDFHPLAGSGHCFTMKLLSGRTLLSAAKNAELATILDYIVQVCRALAYLHTRGIVHRDLKPSNILVDETTNAASVLDFGLVGAGGAGGVLGTPAYMAPETMGGSVDLRTDLYALGITLYQLLAEAVPFSGTNLRELMHRHANEPIPFEQPRAARIPPWLREVISRLCAKRPANRYHTANAVVEDINRRGGFSYELDTEATRQSYVSSSQFVGREVELEHLTDFVFERCHGASTPAPPGMFVAGPSGMGKSRLFYELKRGVQMAGVTFIEVNCYSDGELEHGPVAEALSHLVTIADVVGERHLVEKLGPVLFKLSPRLASIYGAELSTPLTNARAEQARLHAAIVELCTSLARAAPYVLYVNDLQWARPGTVQLLLDLLNAISSSERANPSDRSMRLALLGSFRSDEVNGRPLESLTTALGAEGLGERIDLRPLDEPDMRQLMRSMLGLDVLPEALTKSIPLDKGGRPLFIEEVMRTLVESGTLSLSPRGWQVERDEGQLPADLSALVLHRADLLDGATRSTLDCLAVCGRPVPLRVLASALDVAADALLGVLKTLMARRMAHELGDDDVSFRIAHDRLRESIYNNLSSHELRRAHAALGAAFEQSCSDGAAPPLPLLAYHYGEAARGDDAPASLTEKAVEYARRAGEQAGRTGHYDDAARYFEAALAYAVALPSNADNLQTRIGLHARLGSTYSVKGLAAKETAGVYTRGRDLLTEVDDSPHAFPILFGYWYSKFAQSEVKLAAQASQEMLEAAERTTDGECLLQSHHSAWVTLMQMSRYGEARYHIQKGLEIFDPSKHVEGADTYGGHEPGSCAWRFLAMAEVMQGNPDRAREAADLAWEMSRIHPRSLALLAPHVGLVRALAGDVAGARRAAEEAMPVAEKHSMIPVASSCRLIIGWADSEGGEPPAFAEMRDAMMAWEKGFGALERSTVAYFFAAAFAGTKDAAKVEAYVLSTLAPDRFDGHFAEAELWRIAGDIATRRGERAEARRRLGQALSIARNQGATLLELRACVSLARLEGAAAWQERLSTLVAAIEGETPDVTAARALLRA